jgi:thymidylate synthase (FAD)
MSNDFENENVVRILGYYGSDNSHCLSAWQSTFEELDIELPKNINDRIDVIFAETCKLKKKTPMELLNVLASAGHHTPFEKSTLHFQVRADIASHIHCLKHRISVSINSESQRYKELTEDNFYIPGDWSEEFQSLLTDHCLNSFEKYHEMIENLVSQGFSRKRAKESARYFLPYATQLNFDIMFNFRSFMHFQGLRNSPHAQLEIKEIAEDMLLIVKELPGNPFELSLRAFGY